MSGLVTANLGSSSGLVEAPSPRNVVKTADETVNNSNTLQNDNHLVLPLNANTRYAIELWLNVNPNYTASDFACLMSLPSGSTMIWHTIYVQQSSRGSKDGNQAAKMTLLAFDSGSHFMPINGQILVGSTAGNAQFQWAQETAQSEDTIILAGSWMRLTEF